MKKLLLLLAILSVCLNSMAATLIGEFYYELDELNHTAKLVSTNPNHLPSEYAGSSEAIIPEKVTFESKDYSVTVIGGGAFRRCPLLTSVTIPGSVETIGASAFLECTALTSVTIPSGVRTISESAFCRCSELVSLTIEEGVTRIENVAFNNCSKLTEVVIPESVEYLGMMAISQCPLLTSITILSSTVSFDTYTFYGCPLASITCSAVVPPTCTNGTFDNTVYDGKLIIPEASKYAYHDAAVWSKFFKDVPVDDKATNTFVPADYVDKYRDVQLTGRTLFHDGSFNTLCLPFDMSAADIAHSPLADYFKLKRFVSATVTNPGTADEELQITMENAHTIEAGVPYFISWESGADVVAPEFEAVKITAASGRTIGTSGDAVQCVGSFSPVSFTEGDYSKLFVGADNTLYWSSTNSSLKGFRAHFIINGASSAPARAGMRARIVEAPEVATGDPLTPCLEGKVVGTKAIVDGQLVITCGDRQYNAQGQLIK